jgi:hypothetical protein
MSKYNAAIGSCASGDGLKDAGVAGWGSGLMYLGAALMLYLTFVHDFNEPI